ncbi:MAG: hypothetical protein P1U63_00520 [Coxiellaceae bacterium]|nr:hypothetical protein [Coxiellaceae bacterium]
MRNPITDEKTRQSQLQSTLIRLLQADKGTRDPVTQGLLRITLTPTDFAAITDDQLAARDITREELTQLQHEHPFGIEVNLSDSSKRAESDVTDNVLDLNLANLHAVAMTKGNPANQPVITRLYQQYDQQRIFLRQLNIPEKEKIKRANTIVQHFFNAVGTVLSESGVAKPDKLPKLISHWLQEYRSERAQRDHVAIQVNRGKSITNFLENDAATSAHIQSYRRWYERDDKPRPTATAHNYESEVPNFAEITEASVNLNATNTPAVSVTHIGQSHGSLAPAVEYSTKGSTVSTDHMKKKHNLALKAYTNMQRLIIEDHRHTHGFTAHVYTHLLTASKHLGAAQGQVHQFLDQRMAAYALPKMIYMDYGINGARDHLNDHQSGVNNMAMVALYQHFIDTIEPCDDFLAIERMGSASGAAERSGATLYRRYLTEKQNLTDTAQSYIGAYTKRLQLSAEHDNPDTKPVRKVQIKNLLQGGRSSMGHIQKLREQVKQHEKTVHGLATDLADMIKNYVDNTRTQTYVTTALSDDSTEADKTRHYAKQAMFVIQQLREMNKPTSIKTKSLTWQPDSTQKTPTALQKAKTWKSNVANGVLQAMIQIVSSSIGLHTSSGCKSANDRQYVVAATVSALAKRMERGEPIATTDLKAMLTVLNGERQAEYGKNAAALQTVLDNGGYPKAKGGSAFSKPVKDGVGAGAGESASATTRTVRHHALFKKQVIVARKDQGTASDAFASHKIKDRKIDPSDKTTVRQLAMRSQSNKPNTVLFNATDKLVNFQTTLVSTDKFPSRKANLAELNEGMSELCGLSYIEPKQKIIHALQHLNSFMLIHAIHDSELQAICQEVFDDILTLCYGDRETLLLTISDMQPKAGNSLAANAAIANQVAELDAGIPAALPSDRPGTVRNPHHDASTAHSSGGFREQKGGRYEPDDAAAEHTHPTPSPVDIPLGSPGDPQCFESDDDDQTSPVPGH